MIALRTRFSCACGWRARATSRPDVTGRLPDVRRRRVEAAVITGAQLKGARVLGGWTRLKLSSRAGLHAAIVERAEEAAGGAARHCLPSSLLPQNVLKAAGVELQNGDKPGVRLKAKGAI